MNTLNLDQKAAQFAQTVVKNAKSVSGISKPIDTLERLVTKTLGVLQEQGVYAMMLFLYSRTSDEQKIAPAVRAQLFEAVKALPKFAANDFVPNNGAKAEAALQFYSEHILQDLDTLLLVRDLYEQTLIYARFGAKAEGK